MADVKITDLPLDGAPTADDLIITVDDPAGAKVTKKATIGSALAISLGWIDSSTYASINAAVAAIGGTQKTLVVSTAETITGDLVIPVTLNLVILKGGSIIKAGAFVVTINGPFEAGLYQVFSGFSAGDITFGPSSLGVGEVPKLEWYGSYTPKASDTMVFDDFFRSNRTLDGDLTASGHKWNLSGVGAATCAISNGMMVSTSNVYAYLPFGKLINTIEGVFNFVPGAGANELDGVQLTLIADHSDDINSMLHLEISPIAWVLKKRVSGEAPPWTILLFGTHNLLTDGTKYRISMSISGTTVTIIPPDGRIQSATDADIATIDPQYGCWQIVADVDHYTGRWNGISIGDTTKDTHAILSGSAPLGEIGFLKGIYGSRRQRLSFTTPPTVGWYRIATHDTLITLFMAGEILLSAFDIYSVQVWKFNVGTVTSTIAPIITNKFCFSDGIFAYARLSTESGVTVGLDIYLGAARAATVNIDFMGHFVPVSTPIVGATALPTGSTVLTFDPDLESFVETIFSWDPASLNDGSGETKVVTVVGAVIGDFVMVAAPYDLQDCIVTGYVQAADTVEIRLQNESGGVIDLASGAWKVRVIK